MSNSEISIHAAYSPRDLFNKIVKVIRENKPDAILLNPTEPNMVSISEIRDERGEKICILVLPMRFWMLFIQEIGSPEVVETSEISCSEKCRMKDDGCRPAGRILGHEVILNFRILSKLILLQMGSILRDSDKDPDEDDLVGRIYPN